ncbi:MAG: DNA-protecting protein DprA [Candidatus Firestonebacteria bacterium]|nr:DNA-protecting protein DprA [Candidatus Firestonebacteria bacterium]
MQDNSISSWITLHNIPYIGPQGLYKLLEHFKSPENIFSASKNDLLHVQGINEKTADSILNNKNKISISKQISWIEKNNIKVLKLTDIHYPVNLKSIFLPPPILYIHGEIKDVDRVSLAIVGARVATIYGKVVTQTLCRELICSGITIVSGLARGIDSVAHQTTLDCGGRTIAVMGCGLDIIYPPENRALYKAVSENGAVISEFPLGTGPNKFNFPRRNRIINGLSLGTLLIEAGEKSGSLITAGYALEEGREIFAVPGNLTSKKSIGTNTLIKKGEAKLVQNADDIIDELSPLVKSICGEFLKKTKENKEEIVLSIEEEKALGLISNSEAVHIDNIILAAKKSCLYNIFSLLLSLELKGKIRQLPGKNFIQI